VNNTTIVNHTKTKLQFIKIAGFDRRAAVLQEIDDALTQYTI
tara:strand:+ start:243 stop:368 length:126 start_codon:yes stop_codon:yes gene_type:complete